MFRIRTALRGIRSIAILLVALMTAAGCAPVVEFLADTQQEGDAGQGVTYYVGGAGPIGHVGSWDVPRGLTDAGYRGRVEVFAWQSMTHAGDQLNLARNRAKALDLATRIKRYRRHHPDQPVNIVALSAGTGVATFALESLPEGARIDHVIFLGCSLSSNYDMTRALRRIRGGLYVIFSPYDQILRNVVRYTGTVDRSSALEGVAGLDGFRLPPSKGPDTDLQYGKIKNVPYRLEFSEVGYGGGHTDAVQRAFIREYIADVLRGEEERLLGGSDDMKDNEPVGPTPSPAGL